MNASMPAAIQSFFAATNAGDRQAFVAAFAPDATLVDWGRTYAGSSEIARWNESDNIGVGSRLDVQEWSETGGRYRVKVAVSGGGFNGIGTMTFTVANDRISRLEIT